MNSQPEENRLLQKIKNAIDVGEKTIPRIFLARNSMTQLSRCMFSSKKIEGTILLTAILNQKPSCQTNLVFLHDYYVMYMKW